MKTKKQIKKTENESLISYYAQQLAKLSNKDVVLYDKGILNEENGVIIDEKFIIVRRDYFFETQKY